MRYDICWYTYCFYNCWSEDIVICDDEAAEPDFVREVFVDPGLVLEGIRVARNPQFV